MNTKLTHPLFLVTFGVILFAVSMNLSAALEGLGRIIDLIFPILLGLLIAFVLNVPMTGFERLLHPLFAKTKLQQTPPAVSLALTLACIALVLVLACTWLVPTLVSSVQSIIPLVQRKWPEWMAILNRYEIDTSRITAWFSTLNLSSLPSDIGELLSSVVSGVRTTISSFTSGVFGLIIAAYILLSKHLLAPQTKKLIYAYLKKPTADRLCYVARLSQDTYAKFLSGQCTEAILLGVLIASAFTIFRIPYAALTGFLTAICAFVPYVGAFLSLFFGAVLVLMTEPAKILWCIVVYMAVQFIENQFIYPHVVGGSVGLSPLWTLIAALIGGKLFGLTGIIFFIPLAAVLYTLLRDDANRRLECI